MARGPAARPFWSGVASGFAIVASLTASAGGVRAEIARCHLSAEQIFEQADPKVMEICSDAINQFRVWDRVQSSLGTGFLMKDGVILTNYHVIADAQRIEVFDGTNSWNADILGIDPLLDIAVLKIPYYPSSFTPPVLALMGVPPDMWQDFSGFMVETVEPGSAADTIGIAGGEWHVEIGGHPYVIGGDIITEVNGTRIQDRFTALQIVHNLKVGEEVVIVYKRGAETIFSSVVLPEKPILEEDLDLYRH